MSVSIIVAVSENNVIGLNNSMPWHLPADLKHFKDITMGHSMLMGRKTFESIGKPLPGRKSIVITRNETWSYEGVAVIHNLMQLKDLAESEIEYFIIGGAELYKQSFDLVSKVYLTRIHSNFDGDTFFPFFKEEEWNLVKREDFISDSKNKFDYSFLTYTRF